MKLAFKCLLMLASVSAFARAGGDGVIIGNGGDSVYCRPSADSEFNGHYNLDYLLEYRSLGQRAKLAPVESWESSRDRIAAQLTRVAPELARDFLGFAEGVFSERSLLRRRWEKRDLGSIDIEDEMIARLVPENCYRSEGDPKPYLLQTVVRSYEGNRLSYFYDHEVIRKLSALQLSFLLVHEWLWDYTENTEALRRLNWLLHSEIFETWDSRDLNQFFENNRFFDRFLDVCRRETRVREQIEVSVGKECDEIQREDLLQVRELSFEDSEELGRFWHGEFSGLTQLRVLRLASVPSLFSLLTYSAFSDLLSLEELDLRSTGFDEIPSWLISNIALVKTLRMEGNPLRALPREFLRLRQLEFVSLSLGPDFDLESLDVLRWVPRIELACAPGVTRAELTDALKGRYWSPRVTLRCP